MAIAGVPGTIGPYRIQCEIGRGGMGIVYRATDTRLGREVAIKAMSARFTDDAIKMARFRREARLLASLSHPRIAAIHALEEHEGQAYLVLELLEGEMLKDILRSGPLAPDAAADVCRQIADALEAAHAKGVMHRDLKPANVCVSPEGRVKVLDFGLAKSLADSGETGEKSTATFAGDRTIEGTIVGTPGYMSPEQARGLPVDARTDIWAFGCILYECLTGRPAFGRGDVNAVMAATLAAEPQWEAVPPETPPHVASLLRQCLQKDPEQRLQGIGEARRVMEAAPGGRPTVSGGLQPPAVPNNLPAQVTSFVGRKREIADLKRLLVETRLLTLTGSGGCGKTRLALELAGELAGRYPDGIWFAGLAALTDPGLAPKSVASALGLKERPGEPLIRTLVGHLHEKRALLLLDNCEHLLVACAELVDLLLHGCDAVHVLATGREGLGISGETTYRVPSLSIPNGRKLAGPGDLAAYEAVQLFVERARSVKPGFTLTADNAPAVKQVCRRLDGIPLAIELAAARVRALSVEQIAARLDDSFRLLTGGSRTALPRHQTLRATIDWSYGLLSEPQRALLGRLSVFAGGWSLEACEQVCGGAAVDEAEVIDLLTSLVDRSLVVYDETGDGEGRYRLLETVRQYARERIAESGDLDATRDRHLDFFLALAEEAEGRLRGPDQAAWLNRLDAEHENLLQALEWCQEATDGPVKALRLSGSLWRFWEIHGHLATGTAAIEAALSLPGAQEPTAARAAALAGAGFMAMMRGDYATARALLEQGLEIRRGLGDKGPIAACLSNLGIVIYNEGDYAAARRLHRESLAIRREMSDAVGITTSLVCLGNVARAEGDLAEARACYQQGLATQQQNQSKDKYLAAFLINNLGTVAAAEGKLDEARQLLAEGLSIRGEITDKRGIASSLESAAGLAAALDDPSRAARLFGSADRLRREIGSILQAADKPRYQRDLAATRQALDPESFDRCWSQGASQPHAGAVEDALGWLRASDA